MSEKAVTILQQEYTDEDMAAVGRAFMEAIEQARLADPWVKGWAPVQCPSEIIFDLLNREGDPRSSERTTDADWYLVWSNEHRCWWNPNSAGYTRQVQKAGRYSKAEAIEICRGRGWPKTGIPDEVPVRERDALECFAVDVSSSVTEKTDG